MAGSRGVGRALMSWLTMLLTLGLKFILPVTLNVHVTSPVSTPWAIRTVAWFLVAWNKALDSTFCWALETLHVTFHEKSTLVLFTQGATCGKET